MIKLFFSYFGLFILFYYLALSLIYLGLFFEAALDIRRRLKEHSITNLESIFNSPFTLPVTLIIPAFSESTVIVESVKNLLRLKYPQFEVIVVDDGSKDSSLEKLSAEFELRREDYPFKRDLKTKPIHGIFRSRKNPRLKVVSKERGGRGDALNAGLNEARYPLVGIVDADSLMPEDTLLKMIDPLLKDPTKVVAMGGQVGVGNGFETFKGKIKAIKLPRGKLPLFQLLEYLRAFIVGRVGWALFNSLPIISGAFGLFQRKVLLEVGGYNPLALGEDMELSIRLHKHFRKKKIPYKLAFVPDAVCFTEVPSTLKALSRQRNRWHRGLLELLIFHKEMIFNPRYGFLGMVTLPYFFLFELLGPVIEFFGYILLPVGYFLGAIPLNLILLVVAVAVAFDILFTLIALVLERITFNHYPSFKDFLLCFFFSILENLGYRQVTVLFRVKGIIDYFRGVRSWETLPRRGFKPRLARQ